MNIESLKEKFWKGETSLEEERLLREHFKSNGKDPDGEDVYFSLLGKDKESSLGANFDQEIMRQIENDRPVRQLNPWFLRIAAAVVLLATITLFRYFRGEEIAVQTEIAETTAPEISDAEVAQAYEQTREALLLISSKLNKGQQPAMLLGKFDQANQQVKHSIEQ